MYIYLNAPCDINFMKGIYYSKNGGQSWALSSGTLVQGNSWTAIASSSTGQFMVAGTNNPNGNYDA